MHLSHYKGEVFFYVGKAFCLRGGQEQRDFKISQFVRSTDPDCYTYVENGSKNQSGVNTKETNKVVPVYASPSTRPHCKRITIQYQYAMLCSSSRLYQVSWCKVNQQWRQGKRITIQYQYVMLQGAPHNCSRLGA